MISDWLGGVDKTEWGSDGTLGRCYADMICIMNASSGSI